MTKSAQQIRLMNTIWTLVYDIQTCDNKAFMTQSCWNFWHDLNKSAKWHCGRHTPIGNKNLVSIRSKPWYMNDFWSVVSEKKIEE